MIKKGGRHPGRKRRRGDRLWKHVWEKSKSKSLHKEAAAASGDWFPERCNLPFFTPQLFLVKVYV